MRWVLNFIPVWFILALLIPIAWKLATIRGRFRGNVPVTCPETQQPAWVKVDPRHAAAMMFTGNALRVLQDCSRGPVHLNCGQPCLRQIG